MLAERGGVVTGEGPKRAADDGEAANCSDKGRDERDNEEADGRRIGAGRLAVDQGKGEDGVGGENGVEVGDCVEDCDEVAETVMKEATYCARIALGH